MNDLNQTIQASKDANEWVDTHGGIWSKDRVFGYLVEELWEFSDEILDPQSHKVAEELWDLIYAYSLQTRGMNIEREDLSVIQSMIRKKVHYMITKDLVLGFLAWISHENKMIRKIDGRKPNQSTSPEKLQQIRIANWYILILLARRTQKSVSDLLQNTLNKFNSRDF